MTDRKSNFTEAAETALSSPLSSGSTTINVTDTSAFPAVPFYITIDPGDDTNRETIYVDSAMDGTSFTLSAASSRGQGNTSDVAHDEGARVIHGPTASAMNDLHDRIDADRTDFDAHDHDGSDSPTVATSSLTGHDKAAHDALGIDADTVDGVQASALAKLAGGTFTGPVTVADLLRLARSGTGSNVTLADGTGLVQIGPDSSNNIGIDSNEIQARNSGSAAILFLQNQGGAVQFGPTSGINGTLQTNTLQARNAGSVGILYLNPFGGMVRMGDSPVTVEVDNSTEVASQSLTTSYATVASVTLDIGSDWGSWKGFATASCTTGQAGQTDFVSYRLVIDGTAQQAVEDITVFDEGDGYRIPLAITGRRAGMTTTGSRTIALQVKNVSGQGDVRDVALYARAVRTS